MKLLSWNVNGYRAILKKGFKNFLAKHKPYILGLQETKAEISQLEEKDYSFENYSFAFNSAQKKGYSGVAAFFLEKPLSLKNTMGEKRFDLEGRFIHLEYEKFHFLNVYFPNGGQGEERIKYKLDFYEKFLSYIEDLKKTKKAVFFCGDVNTAHNEIDLARPKENEKNTGFLRIERDWLDKITAMGWIDTFRKINPKEQKYSWWDYKTKARERNVGWRIDYFFVNESHFHCVKKAFILNDITGSDHCPVGIEINI